MVLRDRDQECFGSPARRGLGEAPHSAAGRGNWTVTMDTQVARNQDRVLGGTGWAAVMLRDTFVGLLCVHTAVSYPFQGETMGVLSKVSLPVKL